MFFTSLLQRHHWPKVSLCLSVYVEWHVIGWRGSRPRCSESGRGASSSSSSAATRRCSNSSDSPADPWSDVRHVGHCSPALPSGTVFHSFQSSNSSEGQGEGDHSFGKPEKPGILKWSGKVEKMEMSLEKVRENWKRLMKVFLKVLHTFLFILWALESLGKYVWSRKVLKIKAWGVSWKIKILAGCWISQGFKINNV